MRLGILGHPERAAVDPRGRVRTWGDWSLDWWVSADDRWYLPSQEVTVRQRLIDGAPVVETAMRVLGGDAEHRAYAMASGAESWVVVEVQNRTAAPLAVGFALEGAGDLDVEGSWAVVDGSVAAALPRPPSQTAVGVDSTGLIVYPLAHTASMRLLLPLHRVAPASAVLPSRAPAPADVARGWALHLERGPRFDLPDERLSEALAAARAQLLLGVSDQDFFPELRDPDAMAEGVHPAELCMSVRRMLVRETGAGLELAAAAPAGWLGANWEVSDLPTTFGRLGYAVRWHGERPALLWELEPHPGVGAVAITAPGLDPSWSTSEPSGEALLAPPAAPMDPAPPPFVPPPTPEPPPDEASSSFG